MPRRQQGKHYPLACLISALSPPNGGKNQGWEQGGASTQAPAGRHPRHDSALRARGRDGRARRAAQRGAAGARQQNYAKAQSYAKAGAVGSCGAKAAPRRCPSAPQCSAGHAAVCRRAQGVPAAPLRPRPPRADQPRTIEALLRGGRPLRVWPSGAGKVHDRAGAAADGVHRRLAGG